MGLTAAWLGFLAALAATTANPVTVNREQLLSSDAVVVATAGVSATRGGLVPLRVETRLAGRDVPNVLSVGGVEPERFDGASRFLVPLRRGASGYVVTPTPLGEPLVVPATKDAVRAATEVLTTKTEKPYE